jgi:RHS repeat-associated protein
MSLYAEYDDASRIQAIHDGDGGKTQYWRDGGGRMIQRAMVKHGALISLWNTKEILKRDAIGRLTEMNVFGSLAATGGVPDHALPIATEEFQTDSLGRTHKEEYSFTFAPANALEVTSSWSGGNPYRSGLDYADNLGSGSTAPLSMEFGHDTIGRLTSVDWTGHSGSTTALADYGWVGGLRRNRFVRYSASSNPEGKTSFGYDQYNRLTQIKDELLNGTSTAPILSQFDYEYDLASNLVKEEYAKVGGGVGDRFAYDDYHRLTKAWMGVDATLMLDPLNPSGWVSGQMHSYLTYDLDDANNRTETKVLDAGGTATTDYDLQGGSHPQGPSNRYDAVGPSGGALTPYEYDGRGNLIRDGVFVFRYDYLNRLQEVWKIRVDGDDDTEQYALVQEGADEEARQEVKLEVPDLMQRLPREHMNPTFRARLRAQITGGVIRLRGTGQGGGGMPSFTTPAQADLHAVYAYDAYNRRIMGIVVGVDTQFHTWDGWRQVVQYSLDTTPSPDAAVPTKQFVWGSRLDELLSYRRKNGSTWENYFVLHGGQDTAAKLVNSSGAVVEQYEYDPYGKVSVYVGSSTTAVAESSVGLPFLWKGVRLDSETGLLQMRNRYYSTGLGRFLTRDPLGVWGDAGNLGNGYAYGYNDPIGVGDPLGLQGDGKATVYNLAMRNGSVYAEFSDGWVDASDFFAGPSGGMREGAYNDADPGKSTTGVMPKGDGSFGLVMSHADLLAAAKRPRLPGGLPDEEVDLPETETEDESCVAGALDSVAVVCAVISIFPVGVVALGVLGTVGFLAGVGGAVARGDGSGACWEVAGVVPWVRLAQKCRKVNKVAKKLDDPPIDPDDDYYDHGFKPPTDPPGPKAMALTSNPALRVPPGARLE